MIMYCLVINLPPCDRITAGKFGGGKVWQIDSF